MIGVPHMPIGLLAAFLVCNTAAGEAGDILSQTVRFGALAIVTTSDGKTRVSLDGCAPDIAPGLPVLPVAGVSFVLPTDTEVAAIQVTVADVQTIPIDAPVEWGQVTRREDEAAFPVVPQSPAVYDSDQPYPSDDQPRWRTDPSPKGNLLSVQVHPVRYAPRQNVLLSARTVTVTVTLRTPAIQTLAKLATATAAPPPELPFPGPRTYVVVSTSNLIFNTDGPWNLQALCAARERAGFSTARVTTEWIQQNYDGTNLSSCVRSFAQDAYTQWGTRFLLLAGTFDLIPVQKLYVSFTDFVATRTAEIPADAIYYGCLDGPFDANQNGRYGEVTDGANGKDVDLAAEVMVGRFPVATAEELANMVRKTLRYESATAEELAPVAHVAEKVNLGSTTYATAFMEELLNGSTSYGLNSLGFKNSSYANAFDGSRTLYDSDASIWTASSALVFLNQNLSCVNHLGHGSTALCMKISLLQAANRTALAAFTNTVPYFVYSQACDAGGFDTPDCFAEQVVTVSNAAFAAIMNAREGWEYSSAIGGYSHRFHRAFIDTALRNNACRLGEINEYSRSLNRYLLSSNGGNYWRWVYYELNLFGDPATPFAAAVNTTPVTITHQPLINTCETQTEYRVSCTLEPIGIYDPDAATLLWQTDRQPGVVYTQRLSQVSSNLFAASIPPQRANTRVAYTIRARNHAGCETLSPGTDNNHVFYVTDSFVLDIRGSPSDYGVPDPDYGSYTFASGLVASASAPGTVLLSDDRRVSNTGFFGTGSAPQTGTNQTVSFQLDSSSLLVWMWRLEYRLLVAADAVETNDAVFWTAVGASAAVPAAAETLTASNGTVYAFAEWHLDGVRVPAAPGRSAPAFGELTMDASHVLTAHYLPIDQDNDGNGLPDWWELQYYGAGGQDPDADEDGDGFTVAEEYADRTSPLDGDQYPAAPVIDHTPLGEIQTHPGPFTVQARITDTHAVSEALLLWHRQDGPWQTTAMQAVGDALFEAQFGDECKPGDDFEYQIVATDPTARVSQTDTVFLYLFYPQIDTARLHDITLVALPTQATLSVAMNLFNTGNDTLVWSTRLARVESVLDPSLRGWNRISIGQNWQASTNHFFSAPYALYSHLTSGGLSASPAVHATIALPPLTLGPRAVLSFKYWINSETYETTTRAFDGGIVEYSTDGGATFQQLAGPYTHTIYGWTYSPWTNGVPCFAGTGTDGWQTAVFDLAALYPEQNGFANRSVVFRFHYGADNNTDKEGWYIDDVTVSPLAARPGFENSLDRSPAFSTASGGYKRIFWTNIPPAATSRDDNVTMVFTSNDPAAPDHSFLWTFKIREAPSLSNIAAAQSTDGDGRIRLSAGIADVDGEPVDLDIDASLDGGTTWFNAALTNVTASVGGTAAYWSNGVLTNLSTANSTNGVTATNFLSAAWETRALVLPSITVCTQALFRIAATNGYYGAHFVSPLFTIDNEPPVFEAGALGLTPFSSVGNYALSTGTVALAWPAATDAPLTNVTYRCLHSHTGVVETNRWASTTATLSVSNALDTTHVFELVAYDAAGNVSEPLSAAFIVLDALGDFDGDGLSSADEEIAGTCATNATSRFAIAATPTGSGLSFSWPTAVGRRYTVESTPSLAPAAWQPVSGYADLPGTGAPMTLDIPFDQTALFFRIRAFQP